MPIDYFTKQEFEDALPAPKGQPLWTYAGFNLGEHTYLVRPFPSIPYGILVRSSVDGADTSKGCGEDSIRGRIVSITPNPKPGEPPILTFHGGKSQRWVTRVKGWEERLTAMLRKLANQVNYCRLCPNCEGADLVPFTVKAKGNGNKGKGFVCCPSDQCSKGEGKSRTFFWTDDDDKDPTPFTSYPQLVAAWGPKGKTPHAAPDRPANAIVQRKRDYDELRRLTVAALQRIDDNGSGDYDEVDTLRNYLRNVG
jgi:hypothetical protein